MHDQDSAIAAEAQREAAAAQEVLHGLQQEILQSFVPEDEDDERDIVLEVRAGVGGQEATLFAGEVFNMYRCFAGERGWRFQPIDTATSTLLASISGASVHATMKFESGVHRVQRVPATESHGRVHTSTASVVVLPQPQERSVSVRPEDLKVETMRASGAGGQHVNTTDSAVRITHSPSGLVVCSMDQRSQHQNKAQALKVLAARLADAERKQQRAARAAQRKLMAGTADRSERIRTYNFGENRITDHRIGLTVHGLEAMLKGLKLQEVIDALAMQDQVEKLMELQEREA